MILYIVIYLVGVIIAYGRINAYFSVDSFRGCKEYGFIVLLSLTSWFGVMCGLILFSQEQLFMWWSFTGTYKHKDA
jgi:hypothetical protein